VQHKVLCQADQLLNKLPRLDLHWPEPLLSTHVVSKGANSA